jgi:hypothetical protein
VVVVVEEAVVARERRLARGTVNAGSCCNSRRDGAANARTRAAGRNIVAVAVVVVVVVEAAETPNGRLRVCPSR